MQATTCGALRSTHERKENAHGEGLASKGTNCTVAGGLKEGRLIVLGGAVVVGQLHEQEALQ